MLRKLAPALMVCFVVMGVMNIGSLNQQNILSVVTPNVAVAAENGSSTVRTCNVTASASEVAQGTDLTISWQTEGFAKFTLNGQTVFGPNGSKVFNDIQANTTYTLVATTEDGRSNCVTSVTVLCISTPPPTCTLSPSTKTINYGESVTLSWTTTNAASATLTDFGNVPVNGSQNTGALTDHKNYTLSVLGTNGDRVNCYSGIKVTPPPTPAPTCTLTPTTKTINAGESVTLSWTTTNAASASLTDFGAVAVNGSQNTGALSTNKNYTLSVLGTNGDRVNCYSGIKVITPIPAPTCTLSPTTKTINAGESVTLTWTTTNAASASLTDFGAVAVNGSQNTGALTSDKNYTLAVIGNNGSTVRCQSAISVITPTPKVCHLTLTKSVNKESANIGDTLTYTIEIKNVGTGPCTGDGVEIQDVVNDRVTFVNQSTSANITAGYGSLGIYSASDRTLHFNGNTLEAGEMGTITWSGTVTAPVTCGTFTIPNQARATAYELNNFTTWVTSNTVYTSVKNECSVPVPVCESFTASPSSIMRGSAATLTWSTKNATRVVINNAVGDVSGSGSVSVSPLQTLEFILTAFGTNDQKVTCSTTVTVTDVPPSPVPVCTSFTASPASLPVGGGSTVLSWTTANASAVSIAPLVGAAAANGSSAVTISTTTTFTLTASGVSSKNDSCTVTVPVAPATPLPFTCQNNVSLEINPTRITRGDDAVVTWSTTNVTSLSFDQGISSTGLSGSATVSPSDSTTYTLKASNGSQTISCPVTLSVSTSGGGGGGGSSTPTCDLSISKNRITAGEAVTLKWNSSRAGDLTIKDSKGKVIVTTKGSLNKDKQDLFDGSRKVSPTSDTTYTLTVERGSRERVCKVNVDVTDGVTITQVRTQEPLVTGISLTDVPYTGFAAGPFLTLSFYVLLMAWALYVAYLLVIRKDVIGGYELANEHIVAANSTPESIRPDVFVSSIQAPEVPPSVHTPVNLPTGTPVIGYSSMATAFAVAPVAHASQTMDEIVTGLENYAHAKKALLSSDAIRQFMSTTTEQDSDGRITILNDVISLAKEKYPSEDGWVVINEKRMSELCVACTVVATKSNTAPFVPMVVPEGSGSLAEAIVTGNVVAAYEMIGHRPMFALADAASDLDSIYRNRRGGQDVVSDMLMKETADVSDEKILAMIAALTGALDGVYTDEASAVKMAIMKAVKVAG